MIRLNALYGLQMDTLEAEQGGQLLLARMCLPGGTQRVLTHKLIALCGEGFVNLLLRSNPANTTAGAGRMTRRNRKLAANQSDIARCTSDPAAAAPGSVSIDQVALTLSGDTSALSSMQSDQALVFAQALQYCNAQVVLQSASSLVSMWVLKKVPLVQVRSADNLHEHW